MGICRVRDGELKVEYKYDRVTELNDYGFAGVVKDGLWGVIDEDGKKSFHQHII